MNQMKKSDERWGRLLGLQVVELLDEPLELGHGVVALVGGKSLIDGEGHGLDCGAHLADGVLIVLRGVLVQIDEHGAQFPGDALGRAWLMEEGEQFLLELLSVGEPDLLGIGEREAPFSDVPSSARGSPTGSRRWRALRAVPHKGRVVLRPQEARQRRAAQVA